MTIKLEFFAPFTLTLVTSWKRSFMRLLTCLLIVRFFVCVCVSKTIHSRNGSKRSKLPGKTRLEQDLYFLYKFSLLTDLHKSQRNYDTGWPKSKSVISNGSESELKHVWPHVGKAKIGLRGGSFFPVSANFCDIQYINTKNGIFNRQTLWHNG